MSRTVRISIKYRKKLNVGQEGAKKNSFVFKSEMKERKLKLNLRYF